MAFYWRFSGRERRYSPVEEEAAGAVVEADAAAGCRAVVAGVTHVAAAIHVAVEVAIREVAAAAILAVEEAAMDAVAAVMQAADARLHLANPAAAAGQCWVAGLA